MSSRRRVCLPPKSPHQSSSLSCFFFWGYSKCASACTVILILSICVKLQTRGTARPSLESGIGCKASAIAETCVCVCVWFSFRSPRVTRSVSRLVEVSQYVQTVHRHKNVPDAKPRTQNGVKAVVGRRSEPGYHCLQAWQDGEGVLLQSTTVMISGGKVRSCCRTARVQHIVQIHTTCVNGMNDPRAK